MVLFWHFGNVVVLSAIAGTLGLICSPARRCRFTGVLLSHIIRTTMRPSLTPRHVQRLLLLRAGLELKSEATISSQTAGHHPKMW
jgi:hypothetical protein